MTRDRDVLLHQGRRGRVYVGPELPRGFGHPGYRGTVTLDAGWAHLSAEDGEYLWVDEDNTIESMEWVPFEHDVSVPAATISFIEWERAT